MSLKFYFHPLSSFCHKVLIALYENDTPFERHIVDLGSETSRAEFLRIWPIGKFPVLHDEERDQIVPESSIIIEYLDQRYPGQVKLIPVDAGVAREMRMRDRFFDLYVNASMQKIVTDKLRPAGQNDFFGVEQAKAQLQTALAIIDQDMSDKTWVMGEAFTMADCAAAPGLFYADMVMPFGVKFKNATAYLRRLMQRPAYERVLKEAEPYFALVPK
ncbi:MAG: glutathione S-transferase family protein [Candidatus Obscuribacterales bacterium]|nr:glutathione S-transferase family protein [Steroidobacteraceae bacterium]